MEWLILAVFAGLLFASVALDLSLMGALLAGYALFFLYGLIQKHRPAALWRMSLQGVKTVGNILFLFLLIGMITALWRACGTIPFLIYYAAGLISPAVFLLLAFLLCSLVSFLTGTSFGTAATMGTICMTMAVAMGLSPVLAAGAILSGSFFGDRCSPMSTSALLVAAITRTDLYRNLAGMVRTAAVPFAVTCVANLWVGLWKGTGTFSQEMLGPFAQGFSLYWLTVLPAVVIAPLVPWSIAGAVPLASLDAPAAALLAACYLYLIPVWNLLVSLFRSRSQKQPSYQRKGDCAENGT